MEAVEFLLGFAMGGATLFLLQVVHSKLAGKKGEGVRFMLFVLILSVVVIFIWEIFFSSEAKAGEQPVEWGSTYLNVYETGTLVFPHDSGDVIPLSTTTMLEINPVFTINENLMWSLALGVGTPNTVFNPMPYLTTGPFFLLNDKIGLSPFLLYQWNPAYSYNGGVNSHLLGLGALLAVAINEYLSFLLPVSTTVSLGGGMTGDLSFTIGPGIGLAL